MSTKMPGKWCSYELKYEMPVAPVSHYAHESSPPPSWWLHDVESCGDHRLLKAQPVERRPVQVCGSQSSQRHIDVNQKGIFQGVKLGYKCPSLNTLRVHCLSVLRVAQDESRVKKDAPCKKKKKTSTALIRFQSGGPACVSFAKSVVGCLRCGHRRACRQHQHSCEIRVQRHYKETTSHLRRRASVTAAIMNRTKTKWYYI